MTLSTPKHFTIAEYHRLIELGFFSEDDRVELIRGQIIQMVAKGTAHEACNRRLLRELPKLLSDRATLQNQSPITLPADGEPEPDFAIVRNRGDDYLSAHPTPEEVFLVIEIADSSLAYDQEVKLPLYAEAGITHYWLFNLPENCLETYSEPYQKPQGKFDYRVKRIVLQNETIVLPHFPDLSLDLAKVFPG
ncbi:Uma2 family endonuclease [Scytonema sp. NUACC21]